MAYLSFSNDTDYRARFETCRRALEKLLSFHDVEVEVIEQGTAFVAVRQDQQIGAALDWEDAAGSAVRRIIADGAAIPESAMNDSDSLRTSLLGFDPAVLLQALDVLVRLGAVDRDPEDPLVAQSLKVIAALADARGPR